MPSVMRKINVISRCMRLYREAQMPDCDLSGGQHSFVYAICSHPGYSQDQLAKHVCVNKSTVTRTLNQLEKNGQIATQYVDLDGNPTNDVEFNPNDSMSAIEGILSPDGRIIGKMGHSERIGNGLYKNVLGNYDMKLFASAVKYFK